MLLRLEQCVAYGVSPSSDALGGEALRRGVRRGEQPEQALGERLARVRG